jgi:hypothetical protein
MSVLVNNIDDFIAPSQACINPLVLGRDKGNGMEKSSISASENIVNGCKSLLFEIWQ